MVKESKPFTTAAQVVPYLRGAEFRSIPNPVERAARLVVAGFCSAAIATAAVGLTGAAVSKDAVR
jgi:hypothetical protein